MSQKMFFRIMADRLGEDVWKLYEAERFIVLREFCMHGLNQKLDDVDYYLVNVRAYFKKRDEAVKRFEKCGVLDIFGKKKPKREKATLCLLINYLISMGGVCFGSTFV